MIIISSFSDAEAIKCPLEIDMQILKAFGAREIMVPKPYLWHDLTQDIPILVAKTIR